MLVEDLLEQSKPFLGYVLNWEANLPSLALDSLIDHNPGSTAIIAVDVTNGFCKEGPLASPRVHTIIEPIRKLFQDAHARGVRHFLLPHDAHHPQAVEFDSYPPHCIHGSREAETVSELTQLPFSDLFRMMPKNSIDTSIGTELDEWIESQPQVNTFIVVGDCTDICVYQLAVYLRAYCNHFHRQVRIIVAADCCQTYHMSVTDAKEVGAVPHEGDLLHLVFLYHMMLNGVEIVSNLQ